MKPDKQFVANTSKEYDYLHLKSLKFKNNVADKPTQISHII